MLGSESGILLEATRVLFSTDLHAVDSNVPPLIWRDDLYLGVEKKSLRIGWFDDDKLFTSTPGVKRAVAIAVRVLKVSCKSIGDTNKIYTCIISN